MASQGSSLHDEMMTCPCCRNPWQRALEVAASSSQNGGNTRNLQISELMCGVCYEQQKETPKETSFGISRENIDEAVDRNENFYLWCNGGWMKKNPIPAGYPSWNTFLALHVQSQERCLELLERLIKQKTEAPSDLDENSRKLALFYQASMDEETIEHLGVQPLDPVTALVNQIVQAKQNRHDNEVAKLLGQLAADYGIYTFFRTSASPDVQNSSHSHCHLSQGGLGLPDRDYYLDEDKEDVRENYKKHVENMLVLSGSQQEEAAADAQRVWDVELRLAMKHMTKTENRDPEATNNKMTIAQVTHDLGKDAFDFQAYLDESTGGKDLGDINVRNTAAIERVAEVISSISNEDLSAYLRWRVVDSFAPYLNKAIVEEAFDFNERKLSGTQEMKPRWKRAMQFTETALGEALGQMYCDEYFDESCKDRAQTIVEQVRKALEDRLKEVDWIKSDYTRKEALEKMSRFRVKIGYPEKWIDYSKLVLDCNDTFLAMVIKARAFHHKRDVSEMNAPTDREKWFMTPQTVNAYYHPSLNEIVFPAAILQFPFFDNTADDAVNYGAMGCVVGHEMTHGFDDKGRKFDHAGVLRDWWTAEDAEEYERRVQVMIDQAESYQVHGKNIQGKLTSGENIADLGGLRLALRALKSQPNFADNVMVDGFTPTQRFFISWAQCWRQNITKERSLQLLTLDPHGPNEFRCNGPLSNMAEFQECFDVPSDSPMSKPMEKRVDIW